MDMFIYMLRKLDGVNLFKATVPPQGSRYTPVGLETLACEANEES
jgi:hypothetical protein